MKSDLIKSKEIWWHLNSKRKLMDSLGLEDASATTQEVAICIIARPGIIIEDIMKDDYFSSVCRSTIKRSVIYLTNNGHVVSKRASYDKRCMRLMFNLGEIK